ncbi:MAG: 4-hydroxy-tetrahydrodipicolinate synthase [Pseudomonadales bacterium]|nr:4-hydroxy-tetrahydrodipicolinate synthase [Pseudomonadales bacterium]
MISGSIVALVTPMHADGSIDWEHLDELLEWHIEMGTSGVVPVGTTGESATVDVSEHCLLVKRVVEVVRGRIPVIAGAGANATREAIELTQAAKEAGADACLSVTPYYNKPTQEGLYLHHKAIAEAVDLPQVLYNVPGRTACDMLPETVARCAEIEQVIGIKEATGSIARTEEILELCGTKFAVYSGDDATACELMLQGAKGTISVTANVAPKLMAEVCQAAISGDADRTNNLNKKLMPLHNDLFVESNPIPVKWALAQMGKIELGLRLPMTNLSSKYHQIVRQAMQQADVID